MTMMAARAYHFEIATDEDPHLQPQGNFIDNFTGDDTVNAASNAELVMMHVPLNFGHEIESVAMLPPSWNRTQTYYGLMNSTGDMPDPKLDGENWARANPDLQTISSITGCPMYLTPQKYWPTELAQKYFSNKTVFGVLRDPYERIVQLFKGGMEGHSDRNATALATCDINSAIKKMMNETMHGNAFRDRCTFLPQAEYFEGPYKITVPVDARQFPKSMNAMFKAYGATEMHIFPWDISAEPNCQDSWANDLDCEARRMVREYYKRDFQLLCDRFNYCSPTNSVCLTGVEGLCPPEAAATTFDTGVMSSKC
jgi:hypothetical protein